MPGSDAVFGAVAKLTAAQAKAQAAMVQAQLEFRASLQSEQLRQQTEAAKMKAADEVERAVGRASQQQPAQSEPLDLAAMFPEQQLQAVGGQQAPVSIGDAVAQSASPVAGGAAVQTLLKGGGGAPQAGGFTAPPTLTTTRERTDYVRSQGYGTVFDPVTTRETVTEPNALTAAQAAQLNQAQAQFEAQQAQRRDEQRAQLTLTLSEREGITAADAARAVTALQAGDTDGVFSALGGSIEKANTVRTQLRDLQTRQIEAQIRASDSSTALNRAQAARLGAQATQIPVDVLGGWSVAGSKITGDIGAQQARYTDADGDFKPEGQAALEEVQRATLRNTGRAYVLVGEGGSFSRAKFETVDSRPLIAAAQVASSARATPQEQAAAVAVLRAAKDTDGNKLFRVTDKGIEPARPENYQVLDTLLTAGQRLEIMQSPSGAPLPVGILGVSTEPQPVVAAEPEPSAPTPRTGATEAGAAAGDKLRALADALSAQPTSVARQERDADALLQGGAEVEQFFQGVLESVRDLRRGGGK